MQTAELIGQIAEQTNLSRRDVDRVLRELSALVANELQLNEVVPLPYCGRLVPLDQTSHGKPRRRSVNFEPGPALKRKLAHPFRRLRPVRNVEA
jgi:nucleoid DNA-binding protein